MHKFPHYSVYIFDCDGVILDSNQLKVDAIRIVLANLISSGEVVGKCVDYFKNNFGKSRFHHIDYFVEEFIRLPPGEQAAFKSKVLNDYSDKCKELYLNAQITPSFVAFIKKLKGVKYVASGSEQQELREVFEKRGLSQLFSQVFGSPTSKAKIIEHILATEKTSDAVMLGDSHADYLAAKQNEIDFLGYLKYSSVEQSMRSLALKENFALIEDWGLCQ